MNKNIENMIYTIRNRQIMLDHDVAIFYCYEVKRLNEIVKRNLQRFPTNFCFRLTYEEYKTHVLSKIHEENKDESMRSQIATASLQRNLRYLPYAFTEEGIVMLAGLLKSNTAILASIQIVKEFVKMKKFINNNHDLINRIITIEYKLLAHDKKLNTLFSTFQHSDIVSKNIFYNGQIYDAYNLLNKIIKQAINNIIIIDNYIDETILDLLVKKQKNVDVTIITAQSKCTVSDSDLKKFNEQYQTLEIKYSATYRDRFIIIDKKIHYHCGASFKDLGKKTFTINRIQNDEFINYLCSKHKI